MCDQMPCNSILRYSCGNFESVHFSLIWIERIILSCFQFFQLASLSDCYSENGHIIFGAYVVVVAVIILSAL